MTKAEKTSTSYPVGPEEQLGLKLCHTPVLGWLVSLSRSTCPGCLVEKS